jgi:hypothetical protein
MVRQIGIQKHCEASQFPYRSIVLINQHRLEVRWFSCELICLWVMSTWVCTHQKSLRYRQNTFSAPRAIRACDKLVARRSISGPRVVALISVATTRQPRWLFSKLADRDWMNIERFLHGFGNETSKVRVQITSGWLIALSQSTEPCEFLFIDSSKSPKLLLFREKKLKNCHFPFAQTSCRQKQVHQRFPSDDHVASFR